MSHQQQANSSQERSPNILRREIAVEQRHLDRVYARLAQLRREAQLAERDGYRLVQVGPGGLQLGPSDPVTTALVERDATVYQAARRRHLLDAEYEGLVFGRLDRQDGAVHYVGRLGIRDVDGAPLVIDWRAPAAADFYRATAADPRGVVRRRMIQSRGETVTGLDDDLLDATADLPVVGDGAMLASLTRATGTGMRDIIATIQREQDEAIRSPASGVTVVEGGPGTGKTAVALHRAAYLLYSDRDRFAAGGVLVVGPTPLFVGYISTVLPSLGEDSATLRALGELVAGVHATRVDPPALAELKGSLRLLPVLRRAVRADVPGGPTELRLTWHGTLLRLDRDRLAAIRRRALAGRARRNEVRRAAFDGIFDALWDDACSQAPSPGTREQFEDELSEREDFRSFLRAWWPLLRPVQVLGWLADRERLAEFAAGDLSATEVAELAADLRRGYGPPADRTGADAAVSVADVALLDELDALLGTPPRRRRPRRDPYLAAPGVQEVTTYADRAAARRRDPDQDRREFAHIVVDEAQDVSPMQWRMLGRRGRRASWTVVGDPAQSAWTGDAAELARARERALRGDRHTHLLTTNYRNSAEIFTLAASVIRPVAPDLVLPTPVRATGVAPEQLLVDEPELAAAVRAATSRLLAEVEGTVGVIAPASRQEQVTGWLGPEDARLQVVTGLSAKGMEYDGVLLVEPGELTAEAGSRAAGVRTLYVALSRATQRLTTVATAAWR